MHPKPATPRDPAYLQWLRGLACIFCGKAPPSEVSHHGRRGTGIKASDYLALPACRVCHSRHHSKASSPHPKYDNHTPEERRDAFENLATTLRELYQADAF